MQGTGDQGQPLYQAYSIAVDQNQPLSINASGGTDLVGMAGGAFAQNFFLSGGAGPCTWSVASGQLPPGLTLDTTAPDLNNVLAGTPIQAGTFSFPMQVQDSQDNTVNATLTITINP